MSFSNTFLDKCKGTLTWLGLLTCVGHLANSLQSKGNAERVCEVDVSPNCPKTLGHQASGLNNEDLYSGDYQICHGSHHAVCKNEIVLQLFFRVLLEKPSWPHREAAGRPEEAAGRALSFDWDRWSKEESLVASWWWTKWEVWGLLLLAWSGVLREGLNQNQGWVCVYLWPIGTADLTVPQSVFLYFLVPLVTSWCYFSVLSCFLFWGSMTSAF